MNEIKCVFCGTGVVPMRFFHSNCLQNNMVWEWGCMACGSRNRGIVSREMNVAGNGLMKDTSPLFTEYTDGRRQATDRTRFCPMGLLFIDDWEEL